ncbi:MAG: type II toxin-antitoxin system VapC family toxin [Anaerolineae bacterium]
MAKAVQDLTHALLLPIPVIPEICYLLASRLGHRAMRRFLQELAATDIELVSIDRTDLPRINELLEQYADSHLDFVDAALVTISERYSIVQVLTQGFIILPR